MTESEAKQLGNRFLNHPSWRWLPGMVDVAGWRVASTGNYPLPYLMTCTSDALDPDGFPQEIGDTILNMGATFPPDVTDRATILLIMDVVRMAWDVSVRDVWVYPVTDRGWICAVCTGGGRNPRRRNFEHQQLAGALLAALDARMKEQT